MDAMFFFLMAPQGQEGPGLWSNLVLFGAIIAIFYFMIIRPQQKREKARQAMLADDQDAGDRPGGGSAKHTMLWCKVLV